MRGMHAWPEQLTAHAMAAAAAAQSCRAASCSRRGRLGALKARRYTVACLTGCNRNSSPELLAFTSSEGPPGSMVLWIRR